MRKVTPITEQFQHFVEDLQESFWGICAVVRGGLEGFVNPPDPARKCRRSREDRVSERPTHASFEKFHLARRVYLFHGVSLRVRRPAGRQRVQMLMGCVRMGAGNMSEVTPLIGLGGLICAGIVFAINNRRPRLATSGMRELSERKFIIE